MFYVNKHNFPAQCVEFKLQGPVTTVPGTTHLRMAWAPSRARGEFHGVSPACPSWGASLGGPAPDCSLDAADPETHILTLETLAALYYYVSQFQGVLGKFRGRENKYFLREGRTNIYLNEYMSN